MCFTIQERNIGIESNTFLLYATENMTVHALRR